MLTYIFKKLSTASLFLFTLLATNSFAAQPVEVMVEPAYSLTWQLNERWRFIGQLKMRQLVEGNEESGFETSVTDQFEFQVFANYTLLGSRRIGLGYVYRLLDPFDYNPGHYHRLVQQYSTTWSAENTRIGLRLRAEQRFREDDFQQRYRARINAEIPVRGVRLEPGHPYLLFTNELLFEPDADFSSWDNRVDAGIGWVLPNNKRFQIQLQHQYEEFNLDSRSHIIQLMTTFLMNI